MTNELDPVKKEAIRKLLQTTGATMIGDQLTQLFMHQVINSLQQSGVEINSEMVNLVKGVIGGVIQEELVEKESLFDHLYPIYDGRFSQDELDEILAFYATPIGQKYSDLLPEITTASSEAGELWGQSLSPMIQERLIAGFTPDIEA